MWIWSASQLRIAAGESLADLGLESGFVWSFAGRRCSAGSPPRIRPTVSVPTPAGSPPTARPAAPGIRLDGGTNAGAEMCAHFDSMLVKLTCRGRDFSTAVARARRALAEFRIRGVSTNIPFLQAVIEDPDFRAGRVTTSFIDERPQLLTAHTPADRGTKILNYLADVTVNKPNGERPTRVYPQDKLPALDLSTVPAAGSKQRSDRVGARRFRARGCVTAKALGVTDTTFRDAHQSLLATRLRSTGLLQVAPYVARMMPQLLSIECWGGATYDVALRFLKEDPWERLAALREAVPNICLQMLLRGRNTVGYTPYPELVTGAFVEEASGDRNRHLPDLRCAEQRRVDAPGDRCGPRDRHRDRRSGDVLHRGSVATPARTCTRWTTTCGWPSRSSMPARTCWRSRTWPGCCARSRRKRWSRRCGRGSTCRCMCTPMTPRVGSWRPIWRPGRPGASAVDGASAPLAGTTSQPALSSIVAAAAHTEYDTGLSTWTRSCDLEPYWEALRKVYAPFDVAASVLHVRPGGCTPTRSPADSCRNLRTAGHRPGAGGPVRGDRGRSYAACRSGAGPAGQGAPRRARWSGIWRWRLVGAGARARRNSPPIRARYDIPDSVIGFLRGELGDPPGGWPEPLRTKALAGPRSGQADVRALGRGRGALAAPGLARQAALNRLLFPAPTKEFEAHREQLRRHLER